MLAGRINEITKHYDQNINIVRGIGGILPPQNTILELEAKFGYYGPKGFNSNVPYVHFERLLNYLRLNIGNETIQESTVAQSGNIRRVTTIPVGDNPETVIWQRKERIQDIEMPEFDIRVSINKEQTLLPAEIPKPFNPNVVRERTRYTFLMANDLIQIDMTKVMMRGEDRVMRPRYEVEVEFLGTKDQLNLFDEHIAIIFRLLRGTNIIYSNTAKNALIRDVINILGGARENMIDKDVLVEARNIKRRDLVWGGIVGNPDTSYMITYKADGLRKMLIIHSTGIWLVYPPFEFNLVLNRNINIPNIDKLLTAFSGTILDGELVVPKDKTKIISYWYLAFDCLSFQAKRGIQDQPYIQRERIVNAIAGVLKNQILTIDTKRTAEIKTAQQFFSLVADFLENRDKLEYPDDGLIFIPANIKYNPYSQQYDLKDRSLTRIPDVCKFKEGRDITIDFEIRHIDNGRIELYSYDEKNKRLVPFRGDTINPLTLDMIDYNNPNTRDHPTGTIVEYEWSNNLMRPRRIRFDKQGPNRLDVAIDDWEDIMNPITREDIEGRTLMMTFSYHNRIKRGLYGIIPRGSNILDIGSGRGGDASKWIGLANRVKGQIQPGTGLVVAVEPNPDNRAELVNRINTYGLNERVTIVPTGGEETVAITQAVQQFIPGGKVDAVTLMLSMSFFWASNSHLDALVNTIVTNLKPGGLILFLTINGDTVEQIFEPPEGPKVTDKHIVTADIHLYPPPLDKSFGRAVDFFLPDTIVGQQREYIVHIQDLTSRLAAYGFNLKELNRAEGENLLSNDNALFSSMYSYGYYANDNKIALIQYNQTARTPVNIILPIVPDPINYPIIEMNPDLQSPTTLPVVPTISPQGQNLLTTVQSPVLPTIAPITIAAPTTPQRNILPFVPTAPTTPQKPTVVIPTILPIVPTTPIPTIIPKLNKYQIQQNQLPWLKVTYTAKGGRIRAGAALNDDTYAPLTCSWYDNLVRIATIGDGSCFIHAVLKAFYRAYQENNGAGFRLETAAKIRRDLAIVLGLENPQYPGHTYWETSARGSFPRMVMQQINDEDLVGDLRVDFSLAGLQRLLNSTSQLGDEIYTFVADALNIDIYVLRATRQDLYPHYHTRRPGILRNGIVVIGNMYHYEVLAVNGEHGFQTLFPPDDPFLEALINLFVGDGDFNDIVNTVPYNPDESFIENVVEAFTTQNGFAIPPLVEEIFPETDPFRQALSRLNDRIQEAARLRLTALTTPSPTLENPIIQRLDGILRIMEESGFTAERTREIREIVQHRIIPGAEHDLDAIIASAETDGLLDHDTVDAIRNIEATT